MVTGLLHQMGWLTVIGATLATCWRHLMTIGRYTVGIAEIEKELKGGE